MPARISDAQLDAFHRIGAKEGETHGLPPSKKLSFLLRPAFTAAKGKTLVWCDWSAIEARVLPWLAGSAGAEEVLDIFRTNDKDPSLPDIYELTAAKLLGKPAEDVTKDERQSHGKVPVLSLGYGGGLGALLAMATGYGVYLDDNVGLDLVRSWREDNEWARNFWGGHGRDGSYGLWGAINSAIENPDTIYSAGRVAYVYDPNYMRGTVFCALPSGRLLTYPAIKWEWREVEDKQTGKLVDRYQLTYLKGYGRSALWYGKLCVSGDALVATSRGWVSLDTVRADDLLWDGVEWVSHDGLIYQGNKHTVPVDGVRMTRDHEVLTPGGWVEAKNCEGLDREDVRVPDRLATGATRAARQARKMGLPLRLRLGEAVRVGRVDETEQEAITRIMRVQNCGSADAPEDARNVKAPGLRSVEVDAGPLPASYTSGVEKLRRAWHSCMRALGKVREFLGGYGCIVQERAYAGAGGRERVLRTGELRLGHLPRAGVEPAKLPTTEHGGAFEADRHSSLDASLPLARRAVYDIVNAGPRRRFVVLGACGPFIVHNCENITQAEAASILRRTLKRLDYGPVAVTMPVVMHTHDEIVTEVDEGEEERAARYLHATMTRNDDWDEGLPLAAEATTNWYYTKAVKEMKL